MTDGRFDDDTLFLIFEEDSRFFDDADRGAAATASSTAPAAPAAQAATSSSATTAAGARPRAEAEDKGLPANPFAGPGTKEQGFPHSP